MLIQIMGRYESIICSNNLICINVIFKIGRAGYCRREKDMECAHVGVVYAKRSSGGPGGAY